MINMTNCIFYPIQMKWPRSFLTTWMNSVREFLRETALSFLDEYLERLKTLRDKQVAHSEDVEADSLSKANWDAVNELIAFAQTFVNLIGFGFFGFSTSGRVNPNDLNLAKELSGARFGEILNNATSSCQRTRETRRLFVRRASRSFRTKSRSAHGPSSTAIERHALRRWRTALCSTSIVN